jgi:hypothetical protein
MKGHSLLWVVLGLFQSLHVIHVAHFNTFLQILFHLFFHVSCQHCWHIVNDYKKVVIYWFFEKIYICQTTTTINLRFVLVESNNSNQYLSKYE